MARALLIVLLLAAGCAAPLPRPSWLVCYPRMDADGEQALVCAPFTPRTAPAAERS